MRIGIIALGLHPATLGGAEKQALLLSQYLAQKYPTYVFVNYLKNHPQKNNFHLIQIKYFDIPVIRFFHKIIKLLWVFRLYRNKVDLLFCFGTGDIGFRGFLINKIYGLPYIVSIRSENRIDHVNFLSEKSMKSALSVHLQSDSLLTKFKKKNNSEPCFSIPNGIELDKLPYVPFSQRKFDVGFVGRLISESESKDNDKGVRYLIEAIKDSGKINCLIIGEGPERSSLEKLAQGSPISFLGKVHPKFINQYLSNIKVLVLPSVHGEGFPNIIVEAMSCGTPIVATNNGGIKDIVVNNRNGFLVRPKDSKALLDKIRALLYDKNNWNNMSKNCITDVDNFDIIKIGGLFEEHFKSFIWGDNS